MALVLEGEGMLIDPMQPHPYRIQRVRKETVDTFTFDLAPVDGAIPPFMPGQFNMLYLFGVGESAISISGSPTQTTVMVHTIRAVGVVTRAMRQLRRGDVIGLRGPFGNAWPVEEANGNDVVLIAGGIGLAPLRPVLHHIFSNRKQYGRVVLLYGARTPDDLLYVRELEQWRGRFSIDVQVTVDSAAHSWPGHVGVVTRLVARATFDPENTVAMMCGPEVMMRFSVAELQRRGVAAENIFVSTERNMKCAVGFCGHCQLGPTFICKDGPVFRYDRILPWFGKREI
ncbi:MAG: FAD/NAD(P)-binding protein [Candidatus Binatia bacterium]